MEDANETFDLAQQTLSHLCVVGGELNRRVRELRIDFGERTPVILNLVVDEFETVGGGDDHHALSAFDLAALE